MWFIIDLKKHTIYEVNNPSEVIQISKSEVSFEVRSENDIQIVDITGQLDAFSTPDAKAEFKKITDARNYKILLNMDNVTYVNSTAIGAIVAVAQQVRRRKGDLKICGMKDDIRKVFDLVGASKILEIFDTEQEALSSF
ncbi:anti-sigma factor antagonist [Candidatus Poribacteria bacterium]|nr:anti-sigma factor antagonist [Candidatus Poribacteria bacterium]